jgi:simple sugar transport system permease protein
VLLGSGLRAAAPILLAALGDSYTQRAGVLNLGIEGMMLVGAFGGFHVALTTDSPTLGILTGIGLGTALGLLTAFLAVTLRVNQIVLGLGVTVFGAGLTAYLHRLLYGARFPTLRSGFAPWPIPGLAGLPVVGPAVFEQPGITYLALALVVVLGVVLRRTRFGLEVRAVGESPFAADAAGVDVFRVRYLAVTLAGAMAGLGGAFIAVVDLNFFVPGMTAGRGFMAIAIAMLGQFDPYRVFVGALLFGLLQSLSNGLQVAGLAVSPEFLLMLPYLGVIVALAILARHAVLPASLTVPYRRGGR